MNRIAFIGLSLLAAAAMGCSDDDPSGTGGNGASGSGTPGSGGSGGGAEGGAGPGGAGGAGATGGTGSGATGGGSECTAALEEALGPVDKVSEDEVVADAIVAGAQEVFIDASAGGFMPPEPQPAIYVKLGDASKVAISDTASFTSTDWDVAFKRYVIRGNSGDSGPGNGGAAFLSNADFDAVTLPQAQGAMLQAEAWFDDECNYESGSLNEVLTSFAAWYSYEGMVLTPAPGTWVVRGADGASLYKLEFETYYADPDGGENMAVSGRYRIRLAALQ